MDISRRSFMGGAFSFGLIAGTRAFAVPAGSFAGGKPLLRVGVLSDIHVCCEEGDFQKFGDETAFEAALRKFRDMKADAVVVAGDLADNGMTCQLQRVANAWFRVFPDNRAPDGRTVEKLFICGNHDIGGQKYDGYEQRFFGLPQFRDGQIVSDIAKNWEKCFREKYEPIWIKRVKGYQFVGWHWPSKTSPEIGGWMNRNRDKLDKDKPFFFIQHPPAAGTCYGFDLKHGDTDGGAAYRMFAKTPNAVVLAGHYHVPFTDDRFIWQDAFTSIGLPSYRYGGYGSPAHIVRPGKGVPWTNPDPFYKCRQGMVMDIHADKIVLACSDLETDEPVRPDVVIPLPLGAEKPWAVESRAVRSPAPTFPSCAKISAKVNPADKRWYFEFPSAVSEKSHVFGYVVTQHRKDGTTHDNYAVQPNYDKPVRHQPKVIKYSIAGDEIPDGTTFTAVAYDAFGKRSDEISS